LSHHVNERLSVSHAQRLSFIPKNGNWTHLPNIEVAKLPGGGTRPKLFVLKIESICFFFNINCSNFREYRRWSMTNVKRVVCPCHLNPGFKCKKGLKRKFKESLLPFSLAHTAHRNSGWKNCFGRIRTEGVFPSVTTTLNPLNRQVFALIPLTLNRVSLGAKKFQGRTVHPSAHRLLTAREVARAQAVPDNYKFCGNSKSVISQVFYFDKTRATEILIIPINFSDWQCGSSSIRLSLGTTAHSGAADESVRRLTCFSSNFNGFHQVTTF
jgi:C-5 cytosine-specific DNA methylase